MEPRGLRARERDPDLPARAGDAELCPPGPDELGALVARHLALPGAPAIAAVRWDYARWKPGVSITATYTLELADGRTAVVVAKRYADGKERELAARTTVDADGVSDEQDPPFRPRALVPERALALWLPVADRVLRGLPALLDRRGLARLVTRAGLAPAGAVRKRRIRHVLLRYKPERRAVWRVELPLRADEPRTLALAARVWPPAEAARIVAARTALEAAGARSLAPPLAATNLRQGFALEPWLALESGAPDDFAHARAAGAALAGLHGLPLPSGLRRVPAAPPADLAALLGVDPDLARMPRGFRAPAPRDAADLRPSHGDFHPDQVARLADGRWILMDLDLAGAGAPAADLACWCADWIVEHGVADLDAAADELLAGYRDAGARAPERAHLAAHVAAQLVGRAGATLRRLERGAVEKARAALEAARVVAAGGAA